MIDWQNERVIRLRDVPKHAQSRISGKRMSVATAWRWALRRKHPLETFSTPGGRFTSIEALGRFFEQWSAAKCMGPGPGGPGIQHRFTPRLQPSDNAAKAGEQLRKLIGRKQKSPARSFETPKAVPTTVGVQASAQPK